MNQKNLFSGKYTSVLLTLLTCLLWGSLYPVIKIGYECFKISSGDIPSIILFAGMRFTISGVLLILITGIKAKQFILPGKKSIKFIVCCVLISYVLHYSFTYIALSIGEGSKSAIVKQVGFLMLSCFAFVFDRSDKWTPQKMIDRASPTLKKILFAHKGSHDLVFQEEFFPKPKKLPHKA